MQSHSQQSRGLGFTFGLMAGTLVGAGLTLWLTSDSASELRDRATGTAKALGKRAAAGYDEAVGQVGNAVDELPVVRERVGPAHQPEHPITCVLKRQVEMRREAPAARSDEFDNLGGAVHGFEGADPERDVVIGLAERAK